MGTPVLGLRRPNKGSHSPSRAEKKTKKNKGSDEQMLFLLFSLPMRKKIRGWPMRPVKVETVVAMMAPTACATQKQKYNYKRKRREKWMTMIFAAHDLLR